MSFEKGAQVYTEGNIPFWPPPVLETVYKIHFRRNFVNIKERERLKGECVMAETSRKNGDDHDATCKEIKSAWNGKH